MKPWMVQCCGCQRLLRKDGGMTPRAAAYLNSSDLESFDTRQAADEAVLKLGWTVEDADGPNHRCPECQKAPPREPRPRGAHVHLSEIFDEAFYLRHGL